jgi:hypothetical protein
VNVKNCMFMARLAVLAIIGRELVVIIMVMCLGQCVVVMTSINDRDVGGVMMIG